MTKTKAMPICIREVPPVFPDYEKVWRLRNDILRKPLGLALSREDVLKEADQIHLTAFSGDELLGCVLLAPVKDGVRLRQMAVLPEYRGRGVGHELLIAAEALAKKRGYQTITCHARETAVEFYRANGWVAEGESFIEVTIPHFAMKKTL
jgi:predicted GNAT family N-acyltransferase